jgi:hypothetical protein
MLQDDFPGSWGGLKALFEPPQLHGEPSLSKVSLHGSRMTIHNSRGAIHSSRVTPHSSHADPPMAPG